MRKYTITDPGEVELARAAGPLLSFVHHAWRYQLSLFNTQACP